MPRWLSSQKMFVRRSNPSKECAYLPHCCLVQGSCSFTTRRRPGGFARQTHSFDANTIVPTLSCFRILCHRPCFCGSTGFERFYVSKHFQRYPFVCSESMGISADASSRAFPSSDVDSFMKRIYSGATRDIYGFADNCVDHIVIAVDPAGGGSSQFAVFSLAQMPNGSVMVRVANFPTSHPATSLRGPTTIPRSWLGADSCI